MAIELKDSSYLTVAEVKDWLKILTAETKYDDVLTRLINTACSQVESYINGPVLTREFTEYRDGNNSNVIVPTYFPVTELVEIRIDYNRTFDDATIVDPEFTLLRGLPDLRQQSTDLVVRVVGTDVVLRDDNSTALLGKIFAGSTIQSIQMKYKAGHGEAADELPDDLVHATLLQVEYLYMLRENRDLGMASKNNMSGQGYRRQENTKGMPPEVVAILDDYKDYSLGNFEVGQTNTWVI